MAYSQMHISKKCLVVSWMDTHLNDMTLSNLLDMFDHLILSMNVLSGYLA